MDLGTPWDVLWAQQEGREGPAALSCSDYSGSFSMGPRARPGRGRGRHCVGTTPINVKVTGEADQPALPGRERGRGRDQG